MRAFILILALAGGACGGPRDTLLVSPAQAPAPLRADCHVAEQKCTRCHTVGRIIAFEANSRIEWEPIVMRMRQMPSSGITAEDAEAALRCLVARGEQ